MLLHVECVGICGFHSMSGRVVDYYDSPSNRLNIELVD
jgi:hypothetical protein